jgi:selenide,water dikinase
MKSTSAGVPTAKSVVLVGAGNAHLVFVRRWAMRPTPAVAVTLVNEAPVVPYSAMVPGHIAGDYPYDEITIDLVRLCRAAGVRLVADRAIRIDPPGRQVLFAGRPPLSYDVLSLGLGSLPAFPGGAAPPAGSLPMRPLANVLREVEKIDRELQDAPRPFHLAVVGGGASGCELALALHRRLSGHAGFRLTLLQRDGRLAPSHPAAVARRFTDAFHSRGIDFRLGAGVLSAQDGALVLDGGGRVACDLALWATQAAAPPLLRESGLRVDEAGFLLVQGTLQSVGDPAVFGAGDCVSFPDHPGLPKNGVLAVRQGRVLFDNVGRVLRERPARPFRPQRLCLYLLNTADGQAVLSYGPFAWKSRWARALKNRIDRAWIEKFTHLPAMGGPGKADPEEGGMRCGGCGCKVSGDVLSAVLKRLDLPDDPRVLMGCRAGEDAAVHRVRPELFGPEPDRLLEVQTVDYFKAFIDDPYLFGRIAALNAVSDLYAMNARPFTALAIATLPYARGPVQEAQLYELLCGALETFRRLGVVLTGGHTVEGAELALGFSVTGFAEEGRLFRKGALRPGDRLVLTKPLGSGALLAAWMRGACPAAWFSPLVDAMLAANDGAGAAFRDAGVTACTDVTGFGLAGHLLEMLDASRAAARLAAAAVPLYAGFAEVVAGGVLSSLHPDNARAACRVRGAAPAWLFDPQTSGGLLAGVRPEAVEGVLAALRAAGCPAAAVIGEVTAVKEGETPEIVVG